MLTIERRAFLEAIVLAALIPNWQRTNPFEPPEQTRQRLAVEALKIVDSFLRVTGDANLPPLGVPANDPSVPF